MEPNLLNSNFYGREWGVTNCGDLWLLKLQVHAAYPWLQPVSWLREKYRTLDPGVTGGACVCPSIRCQSACVPVSCLDTLGF